MQINISNEEIKAAVCDWMRGRGIGTKGEDLTVELVSGRGTKGITGSVEISEATKAPESVVTHAVEVAVTNHATTAATAPLFEQPVLQDENGGGESPEAE